MVNERECPYLV